jgi:hypothetical protein
MKTPRIRFLLALVATICLPWGALAGGTWIPLSNSPPDSAGHFLLLSDGTVLAENLGTNWGPGWFRLTPDIHGSYANGTWSSIAPMQNVRLDFSSVVLTNGDLFVASGEYGPGTTNAEIYDPVYGSWSELSIPDGIITTDNQPYSDGQNSAGFSDCNAILVGGGQVLMAPVYPANAGTTVIYNPAVNSWSTQTLVRGYDEDEASWVKLADDSVLVIDTSWLAGVLSTNSERYIPALSQWVNDGSIPVELYDTFEQELGPAMLLPNGNVICFGASGHTAIYTPTGTTNQGNWVAGPDFPNTQGMPDAPAAMLVNGNILCVVAQVGTNSTEWYPPISFYEYNYLSNSFSQVSAPGGGSTFDDVCYPTLLLDLPDGTVLFGHRSTDFYVYQPDGVPLAEAQPTIISISTNSDGSLHLTGILFNGISAGASYGDDEQMDSNFPLVRFTDAHGNVRYGRTYNWTSTGVLKTNLVVSTECTVPLGVSQTNTVQVVVNGVASAGVVMNFPAFYAVTNDADGGPGSLRQAIANSISGATIDFAPYLSGSTISVTNGEMQLNGNLIVDASPLTNGIRLDAGFLSRIFNVAGGASVVLNSLTLTNAHSDANDWGGALINNGTLTVSNCTMAGDAVDGSGSGGAIENLGTLTLWGCTLSGNIAGDAGALRNDSICSLQNCTFYGNASLNNGGAIENNYGATLNVLDCTCYGNSTAFSGGGIDNYLSQLNVTNSILAANNGGDIYSWSGSALSAGGSNIVQSLVDDGGAVTGSGSILAADPLLAPLGNYGGPTQTMPPLPGSPAVDSALPPTLNIDQRGFPRPLGLAPDIGAVEGIYNAAGPGRLTGPSRLGNRSFKFAFTNYTDTSYTVLASTNLALPMSIWWNLGPALESPVGSGQFQFTDLQATNNSIRYYRVRSP